MKPLKILAIILTGLCFIACAHTVSQNPAKPEKDKPAESQRDGRLPPQESAATARQESQQRTQVGPPNSQNEAPAEPQGKAGPKLQTSRVVSQPPAVSGTGQSADRETGKRPVSPAAADARLEEARQNLQTSRQTEARIASELEHLKKSGSASAETIKDYEEYLARVRSMTQENQSIVAQMEAAYSRQSAANGGPPTATSKKRDGMFDPNIPEEQTVDEVAALDRELNESLAKFDDRLLKEMDTIRAGSAKKLQDLAQEAAEAAKRLRDKGIDVDTSGEKSTAKTDTASGDSAANREKEPAAGETEAQTASQDGSSGGGRGSAAQDRHRTDYEDDDIVARQLREAAENESDPELKAKLWQEYEAYKKGK